MKEQLSRVYSVIEAKLPGETIVLTWGRSNNKKDELLIIPWIVNCKSVWKVFHSQIKSNNHGKSIVLDKYILSYFSIQLYQLFHKH